MLCFGWTICGTSDCCSCNAHVHQRNVRKKIRSLCFYYSRGYHGRDHETTLKSFVFYPMACEHVQLWHMHLIYWLSNCAFIHITNRMRPILREFLYTEWELFIEFIQVALKFISYFYAFTIPLYFYSLSINHISLPHMVGEHFGMKELFWMSPSHEHHARIDEKSYAISSQNVRISFLVRIDAHSTDG